MPLHASSRERGASPLLSQRSTLPPERVTRALDRYIRLGWNRSLPRLVTALRADGVPVSLPTLKRWSSRYRWRDALYEHDMRLVEDLKTRRERIMENKITTDLAAIEAAKGRFYARVLIDPDDPTLTPAQRRRAVRPTVRDFARILKLENDLVGRLER